MGDAMRLRVHIWMEDHGETAMGMGRALLLAKIREHGSLRQAAADMRMSYRAAWGKLKATEARLGTALVRKAKGQRFELTEEGERICDAFLALHREVESFASVRAQNLLGIAVTCTAFEDPSTPSTASTPK
ncbi:MAG: putative transcriptional regulator, ModE family [Desulfomicrobiaceae bacterium]|jgi:molybdate transport system regulatory protein|nr:LysR family transcriptional regulator [Desulfomicrobiaceae bacterium]MBZ4648463.1 putative transcriptional regulator, ModE family [Desulfomicrobiaceae bacterium]MBZ4685378.1 putative transcriptional regulator, ModE family [Desulfomicrobiaceae bacterium]MDK2873551.1 molybdate transport system regulatory protein [Desulfomicrobiaceae bacterium]HCF05669.1 ModE family transcriptional regulator [Desulfomicrobiaceae bacterium]